MTSLHRLSKWALLPVMAALGSQLLSAQTWTWGLQANLNGAKFVWNENTSATINEKIGFAAGGFVGYRLNRLISFRSGIMLSQKGAEVIQAYSQTDSLTGLLYDHYNTSNTRLNYIELPLLVNFSLPASYRPRLNIYFGFYGAYMTSGQQIVTGSAYSGIIQLDSIYSTPEGALRKDDCGLILGGAIPMGKLELGGSYSLGFPRVLLSDIEDVNRYVDHRNRVLSLTVGYRAR